MPALLTAGGHQLIAWAVGLTLTTALVDVGPGLHRDHPPLGRRVAGAVSGVLALLGLCLVLAAGALRGGLLIVAPYALFAAWYAVSWMTGQRADRRRALGWQAAVLGGVALLVLLLSDGPNQWHSGIVMAAYAASAALLGGLSIRLLDALTGAGEQEPREEMVATQATLIGLGITSLAAVDMLGGLSFHLPAEGWLWLGLSLALPALLLFGPRLNCSRTCRTLALLSGLVGQAAIHHLLTSAALVPPAIL